MYIALYKDGRYSKARVEDGHLIRSTIVDKGFAELNTAWTKSDFGIELTEEMLKSFNISNLGYVKTDTGFLVYDTSIEEYTEEILPVYVEIFEKVVKSKKSISYKTPTDESIIASKVMLYKVRFELEKIRDEKSIQYIKNLIEEGKGIAYINSHDKYIYDILSLVNKAGMKLLFSSKGHYIVGTMAKAPVLELHVCEHIIPSIIGKGGKTIKQIAENVSAKRININPIK